ncbi:hypothetical protein ABVK25_004265 [Lepraria finkii]|uniref:Uncharacterized protein n=1 Tax=Lepraria finkii TaxID=1340010 RepID=A0ABR4BDD7_9LECA
MAAVYQSQFVQNAVNPSADGYHHGPIPNNNPGWVPPRQATAQAASAASEAAGTGRLPIPPVLASDNIDNPPNPAVAMSTLNTGVYGGAMCGVVFNAAPALDSNVATRERGTQVHNPARVNTPGNVRNDGNNAIRLFVVSQGWRTANYVHEPGRGPIGGPLDRFATECETIAAADPAFAASFGTRFHRDPAAVKHKPRISKRAALSDGFVESDEGRVHALPMLTIAQPVPVSTPGSGPRGPDVPPGPNRDSSPSPSTRGGRKAPRANKRPRSGNAPSRQSSRRLGQPAGPGLA